MTSSWLILADDLTGAADAAIPFAKRGLATRVIWDLNAIDSCREPQVLSFNTASRSLSSEQAAAIHRDVLERAQHRDAHLFKKIDSTLRGHPAVEIRSIRESSSATGNSPFAILAPAFPAAGRTTQDSRVLVDGKPLEQSELWQREHSYPSADLTAILASASIRGEAVSLGVIRGECGELKNVLRNIAGRGAVAVCDAITDDDLDRIAAAGLQLDRKAFFIGSAGLTHALARTCDAAMQTSEDYRLVEVSKRGALIVVGSVAKASRIAARELARIPGVAHFPIEHQRLLSSGGRGDAEAFAEDVIACLDRGNDALIEIMFEGSPDLSLTDQLTQAVGKWLHPVYSHMSAMIATGGETAAALLTHFGSSGMRLLDEIEPGICLGVSLGKVATPVVTKAGAFGNECSLIHCVERLRRIRETGKLI
ncbi:MAG TPA: four-carbon acid sugar kinase family protein [Steroidobacteraceae bacterium]|nr:four-carbon acid sugar kinase family protein [Steroidobacteraceae bacterium]